MATRFPSYLRTLFEGKKIVAGIYQILVFDLVLEMKFGCSFFFNTLFFASNKKKSGIVFMDFRQVKLEGKKKEMGL